MNQKIDDRNKKFDVLYASVQSAGLKASKLKGGLRVSTDSGIFIDIFSLSGNPDQIRARIKLKEADPLRRQAFVESIHNTLSGALKGTATADSFYKSRETAGVYIYNSVIKIKNSLSDDDPIEIDDDAIEIIDEAEPGPDGNTESDFALDFGSATDGEAGADDLAAFELDFGSEQENRLKVGKSLAEEALEQLEAVDSKTLRQSLDMMSLKRSSAVRLAVTRIFRSSNDVAELERTVRDEAKRILSGEDRAELQKVKSLCGNSFLDPVINMLWQEVFS